MLLCIYQICVLILSVLYIRLIRQFNLSPCLIPKKFIITNGKSFRVNFRHFYNQNYLTACRMKKKFCFLKMKKSHTILCIVYIIHRYILLIICFNHLQYNTVSRSEQIVSCRLKTLVTLCVAQPKFRQTVTNPQIRRRPKSCIHFEVYVLTKRERGYFLL